MLGVGSREVGYTGFLGSGQLRTCAPIRLGHRFFRPLGADLFLTVPMACAMGCTLSLLRSLAYRVSRRE